MWWGGGWSPYILREVKQEVFEGEITPIFQTVIGTKYALEGFLGVSFFTREWKVLNSYNKYQKGNKSRSYLLAQGLIIFYCVCK